MKSSKFVKSIEKLINPMNISTIQFMSSFSKFLPKKIQSKMIESSGKRTPYMGFVVEPYSYFLCYELTDLAQAKSLIPDNFQLVKSQIFTDDEPKYYGVFGCFNVHTSAFWGQRMEFYIIAEDKNTGLLSWIIVDYDSNTISYDKEGGLVAPSCNNSVITTDFNGNILVEVVPVDQSRQLVFDSNIAKSKQRLLNPRLWIEGNFSIGYGRKISANSPEVFALKFDPREVEKALDVSLEDLNMKKNTWFPGLFAEQPAQLICFPYAQHFLSDSPGHFSQLKNKDELVGHWIT